MTDKDQTGEDQTYGDMTGEDQTGGGETDDDGQVTAGRTSPEHRCATA